MKAFPENIMSDYLSFGQSQSPSLVSQGIPEALFWNVSSLIAPTGVLRHCDPSILIVIGDTLSERPKSRDNFVLDLGTACYSDLTRQLVQYPRSIFSCGAFQLNACCPSSYSDLTVYYQKHQIFSENSIDLFYTSLFFTKYMKII